MKTLTSLIAVILSVSINFAFAEEVEQVKVMIKNPKSYTNKLTGLKFDYPADLYFDNGVLSKDKPADIKAAKDMICSIDFYRFKKGEIGKETTEIGDFILEKIEKGCLADGAGTTSRCAKPISVLPFTTESGKQGYQILLTKIMQTLDEKGGVADERKLKQGPSFFITIPQGNELLAVYIKLAEKLNYEEFEGLLKYRQESNEAQKTIRRIIETIDFPSKKK